MWLDCPGEEWWPERSAGPMHTLPPLALPPLIKDQVWTFHHKYVLSNHIFGHQRSQYQATNGPGGLSMADSTWPTLLGVRPEPHFSPDPVLRCL